MGVLTKLPYIFNICDATYVWRFCTRARFRLTAPHRARPGTTRTYTATTAFATLVFTMQTVALAVSDSYGGLMRKTAPKLLELQVRPAQPPLCSS